MAVRASRCALVLVAALTLAATIPTVGVAAAAPTACRVRNTDTGVVKGSLAAALAAAGAGQRLTVKGHCHGSTEVAKDVTITGLRTSTSGVPTLDGDAAGSVLIVDGGTRVSIKGLTIRNGVDVFGGGGIWNNGILTLRDAIVRGNVGAPAVSALAAATPACCGGNGGGILNQGTLHLRGATVVSGNFTASLGGGVSNLGSGAILTLSDTSTVKGNEAGGAGGGVQNSGTFTMNGHSSLRGNHATSGTGGGVDTSGTFTMNGHSSVQHNTAADLGGGVYLDSGSFHMNGASSIHHNNATNGGGGLFFNVGSVVGSVCGGNIHDNAPNDCAP